MLIHEDLLPLVNAIDQYPGVTIVDYKLNTNLEYKHSVRIWFIVDDIKVLPPILYWFDKCHCGYSGWSTQVRTDCAMSEPIYMIVKDNYPPVTIEEINRISSLLQDHINDLKQRSNVLTKLLNKEIEELTEDNHSYIF